MIRDFEPGTGRIERARVTSTLNQVLPNIQSSVEIRVFDDVETSRFNTLQQVQQLYSVG